MSATTERLSGLPDDASVQDIASKLPKLNPDDIQQFKEQSSAVSSIQRATNMIESQSQHPSTTSSAQPSTTFDRKKNAEILASQYTKTKRLIETVSISLFVIFFSIALIRSISTFTFTNAWVVLSAGVLSMFVADFFSGIMHWCADTWGSLETPIFGQSLIRSFREHHVVPTAICNHDWIEANGDNCLITLPFVILAAFHQFDHTNTHAIFVHNFLVLTAVWAALTNQIHKWSHTYRPPFYATFMQDYGIIISKKDHAIHHRNPFDKYYCITNGWLNPVLANIQFWKCLEDVVTFVTGYVPREDDHLWTGISAKLE